MLVTLENLRAQARELADMEHSDFIEDGANRLDWRINRAGEELYGLVVDSGGAHYALSQTLSVASGTEAYALASPAKAIHAVEYDGAGIGAFGFIGRPANDGRRRYRLEGTQALRIRPAPAESGGLVEVFYFPSWVELVNKLDAAELWDWSEYVAVVAAIGMLGKEESATTELRDRKRELVARIQLEASKRDLGNGRPMRDEDGWDACGWEECGTGHARIPEGGL